MKYYIKFVINNNEIVKEELLTNSTVELVHSERESVYEYIVRVFTGTAVGRGGTIYYVMWDGERAV